MDKNIKKYLKYWLCVNAFQWMLSRSIFCFFGFFFFFQNCSKPLKLQEKLLHPNSSWEQCFLQDGGQSSHLHPAARFIAATPWFIWLFASVPCWKQLIQIFLVVWAFCHHFVQERGKNRMLLLGGGYHLYYVKRLRFRLSKHAPSVSSDHAPFWKMFWETHFDLCDAVMNAQITKFNLLNLCFSPCLEQNITLFGGRLSMFSCRSCFSFATQTWLLYTCSGRLY